MVVKVKEGDVTDSHPLTPALTPVLTLTLTLTAFMKKTKGEKGAFMGKWV